MMAKPNNVIRMGVLLLVLVVLAGGVIYLSKRPVQRQTVGIIEPLQHVAVTDITKGIKDGLGDLAARTDVLVENANRDNSQLAQIISKYQDRGVTVYVPIFTNTAQTVKASVSNRPIVFAAVTDPISANLLANAKKPEGNVTGVSDLWPIAPNLQLIRRILPNARTMGVVYDPGDPSSAATMPILEEECSKQGLGLVKKPVTNSSEILQSLTALKGAADVLFTANDVTVTASFPALVTFAMQNKIPLFAGDYSSVKRGAIAAVGQNYYNVGFDAGRIVKQILEGRPVSELPVVYTTGGDMYLNKYAAVQMGVSLPDSLLKEAKEVYDTISGE
jgi:putative ABC transport system substrate-binding protein